MNEEESKIIKGLQHLGYAHVSASEALIVSQLETNGIVKTYHGMGGRMATLTPEGLKIAERLKP